MITIAVIGDIGSGKSHVAKLFGYPVFNADQEVAKLYRKNKKVYFELKEAFPGHISTFPIKKLELFKAIFSNKKSLRIISKIVHPKIRLIMGSFIKRNKNKKIIVLDIPLLLENKLEKKNYILVYLDSKKKDINKRLKKRPNFNPKIIKQLKKLQLPLEYKKKKSHFVIKNTFNNNYVKNNVKIIIKKILTNA
tara:strand:+ start:107 stop:685 length:579 start_codon:yes stop_codon:yes gene_type:complete